MLFVNGDRARSQSSAPSSCVMSPPGDESSTLPPPLARAVHFPDLPRRSSSLRHQLSPRLDTLRRVVRYLRVVFSV